MYLSLQLRHSMHYFVMGNKGDITIRINILRKEKIGIDFPHLFSNLLTALFLFAATFSRSGILSTTDAEWTLPKVYGDV